MSEEADWIDALPIEDLPTPRRRLRVNYRCEILAPGWRTKEGRSTPWTACTWNLSLAGVGLLLKRPVDRAAVLQIDLYTPANERITIRGRVVHSTRRADGQWLVGCALCPVLSREEVAILL